MTQPDGPQVCGAAALARAEAPASAWRKRDAGVPRGPGGCPTIWSQREWLSEGDTQLRTNTLVESSSAHRYETTSNEPLEAMPVEIQRTSLPGRCLTTSPASPPLPPAALAVDPKLAESMNIPWLAFLGQDHIIPKIMRKLRNLCPWRWPSSH